MCPRPCAETAPTRSPASSVTDRIVPEVADGAPINGDLVVAAAHYSHVGRRGQTLARQSMLGRLASDAAAEGVGHLIIESSDAATIGRDQRVLLDSSRERGGVPFAYDWRSKAEPLLWIADAIAGAVGEYVVGKDATWWEKLDGLGIVALRPHP